MSEITKVEFASCVWKKVRTYEITGVEAITTLNLFEKDSVKYTFVTIDSIIMEHARNLILQYGRKGLRTLDSLQLASAISVSQVVGLFVTSDNLLKTIFNNEGLQTERFSS